MNRLLNHMNRWQNVVQMCRENNRFAQNRLYEAFAGRLYRLCMRYVSDAQEAEEVLMNGFLKFFTGLSTFEYRDDNSLEVWLKRIVVNEALMHLRRQKALRAYTEAADQPETAYTPNYALDAEFIYEAILQLPAGYRTVFNLYAIEGYTHQEIAQQLNINEGTSKSQLSKARALLQQLLKQQGYEQYRTL